MATISVFTYANHCAFLQDHFRQKKNHQHGWSLRAWARHLNVASPSTLTMILKGQRNPSPELALTLAHQIGLSAPEETYFLDLVELARARDDSRTSVLLMEKLARQRPSGKFAALSRESFLAISHWHYFAIREMTRLASFREDAEWISRQLLFRRSPTEVKDAIRTLLKLGLLARDARGKLIFAAGSVATPSDIADEGMKRFHEQALENARASLRLFAPDQREVRGTTFAMPASKLPQAKGLIRKFHDDFMQILENDGTDAVYQLEIAFYPVAWGDKK